MKEEILSQRMLLLCACAALEARGDLQRLDAAICDALDGGVSVNELKDAFAGLYAYTGFPRSLNALNTLDGVLSKRQSAGIVDNEGRPFRRPAIWDDAKLALQLGTEMQTRDEGGTPWNYTFCPQADYYMKSHLFGDIYACDQFSPAERELLTVSALSAMDGVSPQFEGHKECAVFMGNTKTQVDYLCRWLEDNI
ncbi:MAG: carboxymuconolactone decarboxylase family protein [Bacteroidaceae bacterium]|nr:carboxymuconolactone decarboxylase family protein [Bacteroidaceae bacterium]